LALWENRHKLDAARVAGWLFVTSYNKSIKYLKKATREKVLPVGEISLDAESSEWSWQKELAGEEWYQLRVSMIEDAVSHLPERKKQVFRLCRYEGKTCDEVAQLMDISPGSVKDYLKQSTRFIKDYIFAHYAEASLAITPLLLAYLNG
jgi:RNA polymerase sigma-70 factor (ECF subfamily)